ncbi:MAG: hypothetical protein RL538_363 [Candidatus Parcubacteria bacterium]
MVVDHGRTVRHADVHLHRDMVRIVEDSDGYQDVDLVVVRRYRIDCAVAAELRCVHPIRYEHGMLEIARNVTVPLVDDVDAHDARESGQIMRLRMHVGNGAFAGDGGLEGSPHGWSP